MDDGWVRIFLTVGVLQCGWMLVSGNHYILLTIADFLDSKEKATHYSKSQVSAIVKVIELGCWQQEIGINKTDRALYLLTTRLK